MLGSSPGRFRCVLVAAEAVVEDRLGIVDERPAHPLAPRRGLLQARIDKRGDVCLPPVPRGERERAVARERAYHRLRHRLYLLNQQRGLRQLAGIEV